MSQTKDEYKTNSVNPLCLLVHRIDGLIEEKEGDKHLNATSTDRNSEVLKKYLEVWNGIKDCIVKVNDNKVGENDKDYMKIEFNSGDYIPFNIDS